MAIVVEDGSGLTNADAFISVAAWKAHATARGRAYTGVYTDTQIEQAIVRATEYVSEGFHWQGFRVKERGAAGGMQALAWPRTDVVDRNGYSVASTGIPVEIVKATAEVAWYELANPGGMAAAYKPHDRVRSEQVGAIAVTYDLSRPDAEGARPVLLMVRDLVGQFLAQGAGGRLFGRAVRA